MAGPSKQFDQDETLDKALQLFWTRGYEATSMQDLVEAMGINRASMYQTYGNKHALFLASIERYKDNALANLRALAAAPGPELIKLRGFLEGVIDHSLQHHMQGCLINNTAVELGPHDAHMAQIIKEVWLQFEEIFAAMLQRGKEQGEITTAIDARQLATFINVNLQGLLVKSKARTDKANLLSAIDALFALLQPTGARRVFADT